MQTMIVAAIGACLFMWAGERNKERQISFMAGIFTGCWIALTFVVMFNEFFR
jgi:hypothetical protein